MIPTQIKISEKSKLQITWDDDTKSLIELNYLRDECPCANCKGETVLLKTYRPPKPASNNSDRYKLKDIQQVGNYAIQLTWKDGHNTGIYTWSYLKELERTQGNNGKHNYKDLI